MKINQRTIRAFEIISDDKEKVQNFVESKFALIKNNVIFVKTDNQEVKAYLASQPLEVFYIGEELQNNAKNKVDTTLDDLEHKSKEKEKKVIKEIIKEVEVEKYVQTVTYSRTVRGGEEIISEDNLIFLQQINPGAKVVTEGNIELFDDVYGYVESNGEYMVIKNSENGTVIFNGEKIEGINCLTYLSKDIKRELI